MSQNIMNTIFEQARKNLKTIVLPEGEEPRIIQAVKKIIALEIARPILLGNKEIIQKLLKENHVEENVTIIDPKSAEDHNELTNYLYEMRKAKGLTLEKAEELTKIPMYYAALMVKMEKAHGYVAGSITSTGDTLRPALQIIKTAPGFKTVSTFFIMVTEQSQFGSDGIFLFGDCALVVDPNSDELAQIAISTAESAYTLLGLSPKVAMLSYSSHGSASGPAIDKISEAVKIVRETRPDICIDGEIQADAAIIPKVAALKCPNSPIQGQANVLIFPDLNSGNIGYKLVQRIAGALAIGPVTQGLNQPVNDLSRGCSVDDIVNVVGITAAQK